MFSYEEMLNLSNNYRYSYDYDNERMKLIQIGDKDKKELQQSPETDKIMAALLVRKVLDTYYEKGTDEDKKLGLETLKKDIMQAAKDGNYSFSAIGFKKLELFQYFMDYSIPSTDETQSNSTIKLERRNEGALAFMNMCAAEKGKKIDKIEAKHASYDVTRNFQFTTRDLTFSEQLNPNNPMYMQQPKPVVLSPEQIQRRREFVDSLMQVYKQCETDENYESRANKEETDMDFVIKSIDSNSSIDGITEIKRLMDLLYAAQNVSLIGQKDYLSELINQPQISSLLLKMRDGNALDRMKKMAQERKNNGSVSEHKPTYGETAIKRANDLITEHPTAVEVAKKQLLGKSTFQINNGDIVNLRRAQLVEIVARTQGKSITRTTDQQGNRILQVDDGIIK